MAGLDPDHGRQFRLGQFMRQTSAFESVSGIKIGKHLINAVKATFFILPLVPQYPPILTAEQGPHPDCQILMLLPPLKCAWFDENDYFEVLPAVRGLQGQKERNP